MLSLLWTGHGPSPAIDSVRVPLHDCARLPPCLPACLQTTSPLACLLGRSLVCRPVCLLASPPSGWVSVRASWLSVCSVHVCVFVCQWSASRPRAVAPSSWQLCDATSSPGRRPNVLDNGDAVHHDVPKSSAIPTLIATLRHTTNPGAAAAAGAAAVAGARVQHHPSGHRSCESPPPPLAPQHGRLHHHTTTTSTHTTLRARSTTQVDSRNGSSGTSSHVSPCFVLLVGLPCTGGAPVCLRQARGRVPGGRVGCSAWKTLPPPAPPLHASLPAASLLSSTHADPLLIQSDIAQCRDP